MASLFKVDASCTITKWAGFVVGVPCPEGGAANKVTNGYGVWVKDLDDPPAHTLVAVNAAAIKIDGLNQYGRILWTGCSAYCPISGVLELQATTAVQTASGVPFNVGGSGGNANCNAGSYSIGGTQVIDPNKVIHGEVGGNLIRRFSQETRPTLNTGEAVFWRRPSDGFTGLLFYDGTSYFWWAAPSDGSTAVKCFGNP